MAALDTDGVEGHRPPAYVADIGPGRAFEITENCILDLDPSELLELAEDEGFDL